VGDTWICHLTDFLDERGGIAPESGPARRLAEHFAAIVAAASALPSQTVALTSVPCRRRPGRRPCPGRIQAVVTEESSIQWQCPACGDNGLISCWQDTLWDSRVVGPLK